MGEWDLGINGSKTVDITNNYEKNRDKVAIIDDFSNDNYCLDINKDQIGVSGGYPFIRNLLQTASEGTYLRRCKG